MQQALIWLVEDEQGIADTLIYMLQQEGFSVEAFERGLPVLEKSRQRCPDVIILDPPRDGIHPKALPKILSYGVDHIVYISCKATSLARDLPAFLEAGYRLEKACCVDQFCQTVHVETVALLKRTLTSE